MFQKIRGELTQIQRYCLSGNKDLVENYLSKNEVDMMDQSIHWNKREFNLLHLAIQGGDLGLIDYFCKNHREVFLTEEMCKKEVVNNYLIYPIFKSIEDSSFSNITKLLMNCGVELTNDLKEYLCTVRSGLKSRLKDIFSDLEGSKRNLDDNIDTLSIPSKSPAKVRIMHKSEESSLVWIG